MAATPEAWIVLGHHGFIGRAAVQALRRERLRVFGLAHTQLDQLGPALARQGAVGVINCAGLVRGSPEEVWAGQVEFVSRLVGILSQADPPPRLIHMSTERVNGWRGKAELSANERWCLEQQSRIVSSWRSCRDEKL